MTNEEFKIAMERHQHYLSGDVDDCETYRADFTGKDLRGCDLRSYNLHCVILSKANISGMDLSNLDFTCTDLTEAIAVGTNFTNSNLEFADLDGADFTGANFSGANLEDVYADKAVFMGANFTGANLVRTSFCDADVRNAEFYNATIQAEFTNADIRGFILDGADICLTRF